MSVAEYGQIPDVVIVATTAGNVVYLPFNGFTADTLGYERGQYSSAISTRMSLRERELQSEIGMRAGVGKGENQDVVFDLIKEHPVVLDVAVSKADKVTGQRVVFVLGR